MAATVMELYGSKVFNEHEMRERLPSSTYKSLKATIEKGQPLDLEVANVVASVMKRWAIEQGATHYTHWFQPMTGITAEKHDGFICPAAGRRPSSWSSPARSSSRASRTPPPSPPAACAPPLRPAATPPGTPPATPSSRTTRCASPPRSAPTAARRWTRRPRCCAPWRPSTDQACRVLQLFGNGRAAAWSPPSAPSRSTSSSTRRSTTSAATWCCTGRTLFGAKPAQGPGAGGPLLRHHQAPRCRRS